MSIIIIINQIEQRLIIVPIMMNHINMNWQISDSIPIDLNNFRNGRTEHLYIYSEFQNNEEKKKNKTEKIE